ncbi:redoxin domain-containing protein [Portibacter marinus]|uniref:redoxin domain-containing protein n=1 Tax=Portibacter marinus TaxID=2898660 RepID=UPI001F15797A|nr:redoxin domain-containing protein [Portibacter marinus]
MRYLEVGASIIFFLICNIITAQNSDQRSITITSPNYDKEYVILGYYYGDRQLVLDTVKRNDKNEFAYQSEGALDEGVYLLLLSPNNRFIQFLVNKGEGNLDIQVDTADLAKPIIKNSPDNQLFLDYIAFLNEKGRENEKLASDINAAKEAGESTAVLEEKRKTLDQQVKDYQRNIIENHPETVTSKLISSTLDVTMPEFTGSDEEVKSKQYYYYKSHYFDNIDLSNAIYLRTPFLHNKIDNYINKLTPQVPDSINVALTTLLDMMEPAEETYKFYLSYFLNTYARSKVVGQDGVYVYLVDNYYAKGKADWVEDDQLQKIIAEANKIKPTLIGKQAQDITVYRRDKTPISLSDIDSKYLILYFWAPDCGHCKKATPHVIDYYNKVKDSLDIEVLAVCTKLRDKEPDCWEGVDEKGMDLWINASDANHLSRFKIKYNVQQTPSIFILNEDREIVMKKIGAEYLDEVMQEIVRIDNIKATDTQLEK